MSSYQDFEINTDLLEEIKLPDANANIIDSEFDENIEDLQKLELNLNINEDSDNISQDSLNPSQDEDLNLTQEQIIESQKNEIDRLKKGYDFNCDLGGNVFGYNDSGFVIYDGP